MSPTPGCDSNAASIRVAEKTGFELVGTYAFREVHAEPAKHLVLAGHYHDTAGRALANMDASLARGLRVFDAAVGGLGGCPYAPGAAGNVATEAVAAHLAARGFGTGLDGRLLEAAAAMARMRLAERPIFGATVSGA